MSKPLTAGHDQFWEMYYLTEKFIICELEAKQQVN